jgi:hypothetical protein
MTLTLSIRLVSEANMRGDWHLWWRRRRAQRYDTYLALRARYPRPAVLPLTITLTRVAPRALDSGNLAVSFKAVEDGVADWLDQAPGKGQDRQQGLTWHYRQRRGAVRTYAVEIVITPFAEGDTL